MTFSTMAECFFMPSVIKLNVTYKPYMLSVFMLIVVMLNVIVLSVVAPSLTMGIQIEDFTQSYYKTASKQLKLHQNSHIFSHLNNILLNFFESLVKAKWFIQEVY
jgi:hypothetical protein